MTSDVRERITDVAGHVSVNELWCEAAQVLLYDCRDAIDSRVAALQAAEEALREIDREAREPSPLVVLTDGTPTGESRHTRWTLGTIKIRRLRIRRIARAALRAAASTEGADE